MNGIAPDNDEDDSDYSNAGRTPVSSDRKPNSEMDVLLDWNLEPKGGNGGIRVDRGSVADQRRSLNNSFNGYASNINS